MIIVDPRVGSADLAPMLRQLGIVVEVAPLDFGDVAFEGNGPKGKIAVGIERKKLHDILACIEDARYSAHQRVGMTQYYDVNVLMIEGAFKPHEPSLILMEGFNGGGSWGPCQPKTGKVAYAKLRRYLFSISLSGVIVLYTRDRWQTAVDCHELYHYFQKRWDQHTSLLETQKLHIPSLTTKPSLARRWAADLDGVGVKLSTLAERHFRNGYNLATADESEWMKIPGVGVKTAKDIVREIHGGKK